MRLGCVVGFDAVIVMVAMSGKSMVAQWATRLDDKMGTQMAATLAVEWVAMRDHSRAASKVESKGNVLGAMTDGKKGVLINALKDTRWA